MISFPSMPQIPIGLLHEMYEIKETVVFDQENGGQYVPTPKERISFMGAVLPVSDKDLVRDTAGVFNQYSEKIYTNGYAIPVGAKVEDRDGNVYTVIQELGHNSIHPLKRYLVERKGAVQL